MPENRGKEFFATALCALVALPASAQPTLAPAPAPALEHQSAFGNYRPWVAPEVQPWRASNDTVRDIGGWRSYAREIGEAPNADTLQREPSPAAAPARPDAVKPGAGHGGHAR